jgi:hypothetical protein
MSKKQLLRKTFNSQIMDFAEDMRKVFPEESDLIIFQDSMATAKKAKPDMLIEIWNSHIIPKYGTDIIEGNVQALIDRDYTDHVENAGICDEHVEKIKKKMGVFKNYIVKMDNENRQKVLGYLQNLTKLCDAYYNSN